MTLGLLFWLLFILWVIFGGITIWGPGTTSQTWWVGGDRLLFVVMIFLLGWQVFGFIVRG